MASEDTSNVLYPHAANNDSARRCKVTTRASSSLQQREAYGRTSLTSYESSTLAGMVGDSGNQRPFLRRENAANLRR
jgi:hypothetical protein